MRHQGQRLIARCPACAEAGQDKAGDHLVIFPDGAFACVANQGDRAHRRRIWQLAGDCKPRKLTVRTPPWIHRMTQL